MSTTDEFIFVGCYTGESGGTGEGIALLRREPGSGLLTRLGVVARTPSPSFLAAHPRQPVLYAVNEVDDGAVSAFAVSAAGRLTPLAVRGTGGAYPCHLAVSADGRHLLAANYGSGSVAVFPLDADGVPGDRSDLVGLHGGGPVAGRQDGPHAHMVAPVEYSADVLVVDLGADRVVRLRLDPVSGRLAVREPTVSTAPGTGPRHLVRTADGALLVVGELSADLTWFRPDPADGRPRAVGSTATSASTGAGVPPAGGAGSATVQPSGIVMARDGRFVYVANRGVDTVSVFAWDGSAAIRTAEVPVGGEWPRHLTIVGEHLYVANERSHSVTALRIDPESGLPRPDGEPTREPSPTCLLRWAPTMAGG